METSRDSYQKLGDPGDEVNNTENNSTKFNKKDVIIIIAIIIAVVLVIGVVVLIIRLSLSSENSCHAGTYLASDGDSKCYDCPQNCKGCEGTKSQSRCTVCSNGFLLDDDICVIPYSIKGEYNITNKSEIIQLIKGDIRPFIETMNIDGNQLDKPIIDYQFNTTGKHKVYFRLLSNVRNLSNLFYSREELTSVVFAKDFDTTNVTNMIHMFNSCGNLTSVSLPNVNTTYVNDIEEMFFGCNQLDYVDISKFVSNMSNVSLFDNLPSNGFLGVTKEFYEKIKNQIPKDWYIRYSN